MAAWEAGNQAGYPMEGCECDYCQQARSLRDPAERRRALARASKLLKSLLTPEQAEDYAGTRGFNVRGSDGGLYRVNPRTSTHNAVVRLEDGWGTSVWCSTVYSIPGDNAVGLLLNLQADADMVLRSGCHDTCRNMAWKGRQIGDYGGAI